MPSRKSAKQSRVSQNTTSHLETGAGAALAWIANEEVELRKEIALCKTALHKSIELQSRPPANRDGEDFDKLVRIARSNLDDVTDRHNIRLRQLREYDRSVEPAKRAATESITRADGSRVFALATIYLRTACERFKESIVPRIRESKTDEEGFTIVEQAFKGAFENAMRGATQENHVPAWLRDAVEENL